MNDCRHLSAAPVVRAAAAALIEVFQVPFRWSDLAAFRPRMPRTLRSRLALTFAALVLVLWTVFGIYLVIAARVLYVDRLSDQLAAQAQLVGGTVAPAIGAGGGVDDIDPLVKRLGSRIEGRITVIAPDGTVLGDSEADPRSMTNHAGRPEVREAATSGIGREQRHSATLDSDFLYVAVPIPEHPGAVARVALPLGEVHAAERRIQRSVAAAAAIGGLLAAVLAVGVAARIGRPLDDLRRQASAVAAGQLDVAVTPAATRELGELGRAFNHMTTRLRHLVAEIDQSRARLETMLANLSDGVVITDAAGTVLQFNAAAATLFEAPESGQAGQPLIVLARDHEVAELVRSALESGTAKTATISHGRTSRTIEAVAQPLGDGDDRLGLLVLHDVTELRRLERMRQEFVANVSHELRTPLASIRVLLETLESGAATDPEIAAEFFARAIGEVDRLNMLIDELLELARLDSANVTLTMDLADPAEMIGPVAERMRPQAERAHVDLTVDVPAGLPQVRVDQVRIEHVILNLVHNAIKFTPAGGSITIGATASDGVLTVSVSDTGVGISEEDRERLFERFYKVDKGRSTPGTGLGLAIAKHIVQVHGGRIWAEPNAGPGATFRFTLATID